MRKLLFIALTFFSFLVRAQKTDTVIIDASKVNTKAILSGEHRYLVYFKNGKDSSRTRYQMWTRKVERLNYQNRPAISVTQEWENNDTVFHTVYTVCDEKTFAPLYQKSWAKGAGNASFDFLSKAASYQDVPLTDEDTARNRKGMWAAFKNALQQPYILDWHLDLEVFPILPYKENTTFLINFYDPGFPAPKYQPYTVSGSGTLTGYDGQPVECWLLQHNASATSTETFWISKKTKEVLKLEQEFGGRYRYKIKLPFST